MKYAFIQQHRERYSLQSLSCVLQVSRSGYYDWLGRAPSPRRQANNALLEHIRAVHTQHRQAYGAVKTWRYLNSIGIECGKHRVARLRKQAGIEAQRKRRFRLIVEHHHTPKAAPDLLQRQFSSIAPNLAWVGDMTFIRTRQGWLHLVVLLDLFSRKVVGWLWVSVRQRHCIVQRWRWRSHNADLKRDWYTIPTGVPCIVHLLTVSY